MLGDLTFLLQHWLVQPFFLSKSLNGIYLSVLMLFPIEVFTSDNIQSTRKWKKENANFFPVNGGSRMWWKIKQFWSAIRCAVIITIQKGWALNKSPIIRLTFSLILMILNVKKGFFVEPKRESSAKCLFSNRLMSANFYSRMKLIDFFFCFFPF